MATSHNNPTAPEAEDAVFPPVETADVTALADEAEKLFCTIEHTTSDMWQDYMALADKLFRLSGIAMGLARTNQRKGHAYSKALAQLLKDAPRLGQDTNEKLRSALIGIAENRPEFEAWYGRLTGDQKQRWHNPRTFYDRFRKRKRKLEHPERKMVATRRRDHDQAERIEQLERDLTAAQDEIHAQGNEIDALREELADRLDELEWAGVEVGESNLDVYHCTRPGVVEPAPGQPEP